LFSALINTTVIPFYSEKDNLRIREYGMVNREKGRGFMGIFKYG